MPIIFIVLLSLSLTTFSTETISAEGEIIVVRGNTISITVTLLQNGSYGDPVPEQMIFFFDQTFNTCLGSEKTDSNGIASIYWTIPQDHALGTTIINATFNGNESLSLAPSCQMSILTIVSLTNIEITQVTESLAPGDILSFSVLLTDDSYSPLQNATVKVLKDETLLAAAKTNSSGKIHFEIECNSSWISLGDNDIHVVYEQDLTNFLDATEYVFTIDISKLSTFLTPVNSFPTDISLIEFLDMYIELSEETDPLPNESIQVLLDDVFIFLTTSNSSGIAHIHLMVDERFKLGSHILKILYNGSSRYSDSYFESLIFVSSPAQIIIEAPESSDIGTNIEIEISISDSLGRAIPNAIIRIIDTTSNQIFTVSSSPTETIIRFQYTVQGPIGNHILDIEILENPLITNGSSSISFSVWSTPTISLLFSNIENYASPNQEITFEIQMVDWFGNSSFKPLRLLIDDEIRLSGVTDTSGQASFTLSAPQIEKQYNISIVYDGNITLFEFPTKLDYDLQVTSLMPVQLNLDFYNVNSVQHKLSVYLILKCFNGSTPKGIQVSFIWLDLNFDAETTEGGLITLYLRVPATNGNYILFYESQNSSSIISTSGSFLIEITIDDILSLQGVGFFGLVIALLASIGISIIPIVRRKYLVD